MEKFLKYLASFIVIFSFCLIVYASEEEVDNAKDAREDYCQNDVQSMQGCVYDPNDPLYTQSGVIKNSSSYVSLTTTNNMPLTRGYVSTNADGELIFAGCYKGHISDGDWIKEGDFYAFKIVAPSINGCQVVNDDIVFAKGTQYKKSGLFWSFWEEFDGKSPLGTDMASYTDWTAVNGGECPMAFGITANLKLFTSSKNTFSFANDPAAFKTGTKSYGFFGLGSKEYITTPGCTEYDETGKKEAEACFNKAVADIANKKCPSDYSKLSELQEELNNIFNSCDNKFKVLYKNENLKSEAEEMKKILVKEVNSKLTSCQYNKCNIGNNELRSIANKLKRDEYKLCKSGVCGADRIKQSTSENAKCWKIETGKGYRLEWAEKPSTYATLEKDIPKSECYGTDGTIKCRDCLEDVYKASGLSEKQINCMLNIEGEKSSILGQTGEDIKNQSEQYYEKKKKDNEQLINQLYQSYEIVVPQIPGENPNFNTCEQILGKNLTALMKVVITILQVVGAILAIVKGMMTLIPPILAKDADALKKASKTLVTMAIVLMIIFLFRPLLRFLGNLVGFDISCI